MTYKRDGDSTSTAMLGVMALGAIIGAAVALLLAPRSGEETRELIRDKGADLKRRAQRTVDEASHLFERGKHAVEDKASDLGVTIDAGRDAIPQTMAGERTRHTF